MRKGFPNLDRCAIPWRIEKPKRLEREIADFPEISRRRIEHHWIPLMRRKLRCGDDLATERARQSSFLESLELANRLARKPLGAAGVFRLHTALTGKPSAYRLTPVTVRKRTGQTVGRYPSAGDIRVLMEEFFHWRETYRFLHPVSFACASHMILLSIHPFNDGNGRLSRMVEWMDLKRARHPLAKVVHPELLIHFEFQKYCNALMGARRNGSLDSGLTFFFESYRLFAQSY